MNKKTRKLLGPLEAKIMAVIWSAGRPLSVRDVVTALAGERSAYTTVMTVMSRLAEKGLLQRKQAGKAYLYQARLNEQDLLVQRAKRSVRRLVADFGDVALAQFADELDRANPEKLARLRKLRDQSRE